MINSLFRSNWYIYYSGLEYVERCSIVPKLVRPQSYENFYSLQVSITHRELGELETMTGVRFGCRKKDGTNEGTHRDLILTSDENGNLNPNSTPGK